MVCLAWVRRPAESLMRRHTQAELHARTYAGTPWLVPNHENRNRTLSWDVKSEAFHSVTYKISYGAKTDHFWLKKISQQAMENGDVKMLWSDWTKSNRFTGQNVLVSKQNNFCVAVNCLWKSLHGMPCRFTSHDSAWVIGGTSFWWCFHLCHDVGAIRLRYALR